MKAAMVRGAVVMLVWSGSALAQAPNTGSSGAPGGTGGAVGVEAPPTGSSVPVTPGGEAAPPVETTPPPPPPPPPPAPAPPQAAPDEEDDYEPRRRRRRKPLDWQPNDDEESSGSAWTLRGPHFILSAERMAGVLGHTFTVEQQTELVDPFTGQPTGAVTTRELKHSGTDIAFLGAGAPIGSDAVVINPFIIPRLAFDGMLGNGLTLGGSISYFVASGEQETPDLDSSAIRKEDTPTASVFLFAPRLGVMLQASPKIGVWLRGGVTRVSMTTEAQQTDFDTGQTFTASNTITMVDVTLDPQLVLSPVPHVGILLGAAVDIGVSGTIERTSSVGGSSVKEEDGFAATSYGVTAGLAAIF
jgi:hypothetical protein